jgi:hypothetical protein
VALSMLRNAGGSASRSGIELEDRLVDPIAADAVSSSVERPGTFARLLFVGVCLGAFGCDNGEPSLTEAESPAAQLQDRIEALTSNVARAESVRAVKRLQHAYGHYSEVGLWYDFADLFSEDAVGHYPAGDLDKEAIRSLFFDEVGQGRLGLAEGRLYPHINLTPVVTLGADGMTARARWRVVAMLGGYGGNATWAYGVYENAYIYEDGAWKIGELGYHNQISGAYGESLRATVGPELDEPSVPFHYDPDSAGAPFFGDFRADSNEDPVPETVPVLAARLSDLARRVARLVDEGDVANLQHAYGYYLDRKLWDDVADLFADRGTSERGQQGIYVGKNSIRRGLDRFGPAGLRAGELNDHLQLQTVVTIAPDGTRAYARGVELALAGARGSSGFWREGIFENEYVKEDGTWKIGSLRFYPRVITDYAAGWARDAQPAPGPSDDLPPDRPPSQPYAIYPAFFLPPLHFLHPVTGRPPQYPQGVADTRRIAGSEALLPAEPDATATLATLAATLSETESRLASVMARDSAENVIDALSYYLDERMWDEAARLFARDGWNETAGAGIYVGRDRIRRSLIAAYGESGREPGAFVHREIMQPVIHVAADGQSARIRARLFRINAGGESGDSYVSGIYEGRVVNEGGTWKIASLDLDYTWAASYRDGWAQDQDENNARFVPLSEAFGDLSPDRPPRGPAIPPFPAIQELAFHYTNPVSGRVPALLLP